MNYNELVQQVLNILPSASFGEDNDGQLIIYTNMTESRYGILTPFEQDLDSVQ